MLQEPELSQGPELQVQGVVETGAYVDDLDKAEAFYTGILGLTVIAKQPGRHIFFRAGANNVLLAFLAEATLKDPSTPHGATGPGHFALGVATESLDAWREQLGERGVAIEDEVTWPRGGRSLYFRDPAGNCVELVTPGVWGLPSGW